MPPVAASPAGVPLVSNTQTNKVRADFDVEKFRVLIQQKGYYAIWRKAVMCPCLNLESQQSKQDCENCSAAGYFYVNPIETQILMSNLERKKHAYANLGEWLEGSSMVTTFPEVRPAHLDSFEMLDGVMTYNEYFVKGERSGKRAVLPAGQDAATYKVVSVLHMFYEDAARQVVQLERGLDFEVTAAGWIVWLTKRKQPAEGTVITISYEFHPVWIVTTHPHGLRASLRRGPDSNKLVPLPLQAAVRLAYLTEIKTAIHSLDV